MPTNTQSDVRLLDANEIDAVSGAFLAHVRGILFVANVIAATGIAIKDGIDLATSGEEIIVPTIQFPS